MQRQDYPSSAIDFFPIFDNNRKRMMKTDSKKNNFVLSIMFISNQIILLLLNFTIYKSLGLLSSIFYLSICIFLFIMKGLSLIKEIGNKY